jgi:hypothetical protein
VTQCFILAAACVESGVLLQTATLLMAGSDALVAQSAVLHSIRMLRRASSSPVLLSEWEAASCLPQLHGATD